jgi:hypothetical protein
LQDSQDDVPNKKMKKIKGKGNHSDERGLAPAKVFEALRLIPSRGDS